MVRRNMERGNGETLSQLVQIEEKRQKRARLTEMGRKAMKRERRQSETPRNFFPFSPVRADRPNTLGLHLDKWDCRILKAIQEHGFKPVTEFCKQAKIHPKKFYERFNANPDLREALKLLAYGSLAIGFPKAMSTLTEKFPENAKWAELYLKVVGLIGEPSMKIIQNFDGDDRLLSQGEIEWMVKGKG